MSLLLRKYWREIALGALAIALVAAGMTAWKRHNEAVAAKARVELLIKQEKGKIEVLEAQLKDARRKVVQSEGAVVRAIETYEAERQKGVRVVYVDRATPGATPGTSPSAGAVRDSSGTPSRPTLHATPGATRDSLLVVTPEFLAAADSTVQACRILRNDCATFRIRADSTMTAQARLIEQLESAREVRPGFPYIKVGAALGLGIFIGSRLQ